MAKDLGAHSIRNQGADCLVQIRVQDIETLLRGTYSPVRTKPSPNGPKHMDLTCPTGQLVRFVQK